MSYVLLGVYLDVAVRCPPDWPRGMRETENTSPFIIVPRFSVTQSAIYQTRWRIQIKGKGRPRTGHEGPEGE